MLWCCFAVVLPAPRGEGAMRDQPVLVVQHDPDVSRRMEEELARDGIRVAGPVADLERALARAEGQVVAAVLLDLHLPDSRGVVTLHRFRDRQPGLPVVVTVPRRFQAQARKAVAEGARLYVLDEEVGRGLLAPVVRHVVGMAIPADDRVPAATDAAAPSRRLLHDLGNLLAVVNGECEMLLQRAEAKGPLAEDLRELHGAIAESVRVFRLFVASRRVEAAGHDAEP